MELNEHTIAQAAQRIGVQPDELASVFRRGAAVSYKPADILFRQSTPRQWLGLVMEGEIDLLHGQQGRDVLIGVAQSGAIIGEGVMLDDTTHSTSAITHHGAKVWQISREELESVRAEHSAVFERIVHQIAVRFSDRLRLVAERLAK